jgi:hypothetical protein
MREVREGEARAEAARSPFLRMLVEVFLYGAPPPERGPQVQSSTTLPLDPPSIAANPAR